MQCILTIFISMNTEEQKTDEQVKEKLSSPKPKKSRSKSASTDPNIPPKITRGVKKEIELTLKKIEGITNHIENVQSNAITMAKKLIEQGYTDMGRELVARAFEHDVSKFSGIEWDNMAPGVEVVDGGAKLKLKLAVQHHSRVNSHHPEYWGGIKMMPRISICEMVCDWKSRSQEFGTDLRVWIDEKATKRFDFEKGSDVYKTIMSYVDLICEKPFGSV